MEAKLNGGEAVGHISYVWTAEGWLYLAVILIFIAAVLLPFVRLRRAVSDWMKKTDHEADIQPDHPTDYTAPEAANFLEIRTSSQGFGPTALLRSLSTLLKPPLTSARFNYPQDNSKGSTANIANSFQTFIVNVQIKKLSLTDRWCELLTQ